MVYYLPAPSTMAGINSDKSVLGSLTEITGNVSGQGSLRVDGKVTGNVAVSGPLEVSAGASIQGDVSGESLDLDGTVVGDVECSGPVSIGSQAEYKGVLKAERVSLAPGAKVSARLDTQFDLSLDI